MQLKLGRLENILLSLNNLFRKELSVKISYKLKTLNKILIQEYEQFEESRKSLIDKYALKNDDGSVVVKDNLVQFDNDNLILFNKDFETLVNIDFEIGFEAININDLGDINISPFDLMVLDEFITD